MIPRRGLWPKEWCRFPWCPPNRGYPPGALFSVKPDRLPRHQRRADASVRCRRQWGGGLSPPRISLLFAAPGQGCEFDVPAVACKLRTSLHITGKQLDRFFQPLQRCGIGTAGTSRYCIFQVDIIKRYFKFIATLALDGHEARYERCCTYKVVFRCLKEVVDMAYSLV